MLTSIEHPEPSASASGAFSEERTHALSDFLSSGLVSKDEGMIFFGADALPPLPLLPVPSCLPPLAWRMNVGMKSLCPDDCALQHQAPTSSIKCEHQVSTYLTCSILTKITTLYRYREYSRITPILGSRGKISRKYYGNSPTKQV